MAISQAAVGLGRVGGAQHHQAGHRAQGRQVLDRLVGGAVLAETDRVMGVHEHDRQVLQRGHADRVLHVVGEHHERRADRPQAAVGGQAVADRPHRVLADAEADVARAEGTQADVAAGGDRRVGGARQVGGTLDELGDARGEGVEDLPGRGRASPAIRPAGSSARRPANPRAAGGASGGPRRRRGPDAPRHRPGRRPASCCAGRDPVPAGAAAQAPTSSGTRNCASSGQP